jgi:glycosyltransferase involved in cell wall biosynthesis
MNAKGERVDRSGTRSERRLRIVMMVQFPSKPGVVTGGVEGVGFSLVTALRRIEGVTVEVVSPIARASLAAARAAMPDVRWIANSRLPGFLDYWSIQRWRLHKRISELNPDITHFHGAAGWAVGFKGASVLTIHGIVERDALFTGKAFPRLRSQIMRCVETYARRRMRDVILISPYLATEIGKDLIGKKWPIENPIDESWFKVARAPESNRVLYVGRISVRKNVDGLLRAFAKVVQGNASAKLILAGGPEEAEFEAACLQFIDNNNLRSNVEFLGNIERRSLIEEMRRAACLVLVSHQETAPLVIEEAMAAGVPVIASDVCGHPFMIRSGETGYLVNRFDEAQIAERIGHLLMDEAHNRAMGEKARQDAIVRFHPDAVANATLAVYDQILRAHESAGDE